MYKDVEQFEFFSDTTKPKKTQKDKSQMSPEDKLTAAYLVLVVGLSTRSVANKYKVNSGRISEITTNHGRLAGLVMERKGEKS